MRKAIRSPRPICASWTSGSSSAMRNRPAIRAATSASILIERPHRTSSSPEHGYVVATDVPRARQTIFSMLLDEDATDPLNAADAQTRQNFGGVWLLAEFELQAHLDGIGHRRRQGENTTLGKCAPDDLLIHRRGVQQQSDCAAPAGRPGGDLQPEQDGNEKSRAQDGDGHQPPPRPPPQSRPGAAAPLRSEAR